MTPKERIDENIRIPLGGSALWPAVLAAGYERCRPQSPKASDDERGDRFDSPDHLPLSLHIYQIGCLWDESRQPYLVL